MPNLRESPSGAFLNLASLTSFANLLWVNPLATAPGTGSVIEPFPTPAAAVAAVAAGASATIVLAPGDYSLTPAFTIADKNINLICLGGAETGALTPPARAVLPVITFGVSAAPMLFYAAQCVLTYTVLDAVTITLENCSATSTDAGGLSDVRARGARELFAGVPQQSFNGSCGACVLSGMATQSLACVDFSGVLGRVIAGGTGIVASNTAGAQQYEFDPLVVFQGPNGVFLDDWSLFQVLENGVNIGVAPALSTQEENYWTYTWASGGWDNNLFLNPGGIHGLAAAAAATLEWWSAPRKCFVSRINAQLGAAIGVDATFTLHRGATLGALAATAVAITVTAGQLRATPVDFPTPLVINSGDYLAVQVTKAAGAIAGNSAEVIVRFM